MEVINVTNNVTDFRIIAAYMRVSGFMAIHMLALSIET